MNKQNQQWVFGNGAGLDFSTTPPTPTSGFAIHTFEGCASVSDPTGTLLFYTDGIKVWNPLGQVTGIPPLEGGVSSTQSATIVPDPGNPDRYYIFTIDGSSGGGPPIEHFNGGLLDVTTWAFTPLSSLMTLPPTTGLSPAEKLIAVQDRNCRDYWLVSVLQHGTDLGPIVDEPGVRDPAIDGPVIDGTARAEAVDRSARVSATATVALPAPPYTTSGPGLFRIYRVTPAAVSWTGDVPMNAIVNDLGALAASPDGRRLAVACVNRVLIYPFDNATGAIQNAAASILQLPLPSTSAAYGVAFSPNSQVLYYDDLAGNLFQVDLTAASPTSTPLPSIPLIAPPYATGALQLGPDGRIYIARHAGGLSAIKQPDLLGLACDLDVNHLSFPGGAVAQLGLPNMITSRCPDDGACGCGCDGCNHHAAADNAVLIERARAKTYLAASSTRCGKPFSFKCGHAVPAETHLEPCFHFHWGDGTGDQIEEHDTEVFYITACNRHRDVRYRGLRITALRLVPPVTPRDKVLIVPDRLVGFDCLEPCSCETREFALITRDTGTAGPYHVEIEYCYDAIELVGHGHGGRVRFAITITED